VRAANVAQFLNYLLCRLKGIGEALPTLIPTAVQAIITIVQSLIENLPLILDAALQLIMGLAEGLLAALPMLIEQLPAIILGLVDFFIGAIPQIIEVGVKLLIALVQNLPAIIVEIVKAVPQIITGLVSAFGQGVGQLAEVGGNLVRGLWQGIQSLASWLWDKVSGWISSIWDGICDFFGIHSPSDEMAWVGEMLVKGLSGAIDSTGKDAVKSAQHMAEDINDVMHGLAADMNTALPTDFDFTADVGYTADKYTPKCHILGLRYFGQFLEPSAFKQRVNLCGVTCS
jgi:phage-related protein